MSFQLIAQLAHSMCAHSLFKTSATFTVHSVLSMNFSKTQTSWCWPAQLACPQRLLDGHFTGFTSQRTRLARAAAIKCYGLSTAPRSLNSIARLSQRQLYLTFQFHFLQRIGFAKLLKVWVEHQHLHVRLPELAANSILQAV